MAVLSQSFDPDLRPEWVGRAARAWDIGPVIEAIVDADVEAAFPDRREDASFVAMLEKSITANLGQFRRFLIGEIALDDMKLESPIEFASMQAQLGISHSALQHSYRTGARVTWAMWAEHLAEAADEEPVPSSESAAGLRWSTAMFLAWYDHVVTSVDAGYTEREYMLRRSGFQFRVDTVRQILAGDLPAPPRDLYPALRYDLSAEHLTIQLTEVSDISTQEITKRLRIASGAADSLEVRLTPSDVVVWLSRPHPWRPEHGDRVVETLIAAGTTASVGTPAVGVEGFRSGYDDVTRVAAVRQLWTDAPPVLRYEDVRLEAMLTSNIVEVARFVREELGPLAAGTASARTLCETMLASFTFGTHVATAEHLGLHEHTVRNRLQRAEALLGRPLASRRVELQAALRLRRLVRT
ncbi:PucR family transcriptional regulator [Actinomadura madurae]|uniref:PucR family transcriptional regulator n=1 Tax=Actinomadura madurae TaxID=1993 RepID=UPI0020266B44|nr:PucR family transcriptional regulator [Actinomadura madurae]MCP9949981.1 helix-turn-helix domain-containing protein [Actinomadura madurae]MCP9966738.1 helix-turn-helix domain-containing protein [Actinomadura madurae]MCP9979225.1 helix-turn-helix domain-containing protein [Actinomadura madurae]MCQ0009249.1 helix-turn-helix domain-containing protein [Actinomadura madurae]URM95551.1 helix-turn-helix domain-containing protein [Actinomadura madurae]